MIRFILAMLVFIGPMATIGAQDAGRLSPELLWKMGRLGSASMDASGHRVAYVVRRFDLTENNGASELHILNLTEGSERIALEGWAVLDGLQWVQTPGGLQLFFVGLQDRASGQSPQAWALDAGNWQHRQVTAFEGGVANLKVSPDGTKLAYTRRVKLDPTVNEMYPDLPHANARIIDGLMYRHWDSWHDYSYSHVFVAAIGAGGTAETERDLMEGLRVDCPVPPFGGAEQFAWSPEGDELALTMKRVENPAQSTDTNVYTVSLESPGDFQIVSPAMPGYDNNPMYSPDGRYLLFHSMERAGFEADRNRLMLFDRSTGSIRELTAGLDQTAHHGHWLPDSSGVYFTSEARGTEQVYALQVESNELQQVTSGRFNWTALDVESSGNHLLVARQDMLRPQELFLVNLRDQSVQPLTTINDAIYESLDLPQVEERWVETTDGERMHCWVIYPPDFTHEADRQWPMILYCQGGPQSQIGQFFSYRWNFHLMASQGYIVLAPNRRGLPGFGQEWNDEISRDWGGQAMRDLLSATDDLSRENYIDKARRAAVGASFGGYTTYWLMGHHNDRFCTMIAHCGVFNLESMYGSTEELFFVDWDLGGPYWADERVQRDYQRFSPHRFVQRWTTPLLVIHGERDFRVPITQGMEAFTAAQVRGVPSRFLYFPDEGHWVMRPQNSVLWQRVFFDWLGRYCQPDSADTAPAGRALAPAGG